MEAIQLTAAVMTIVNTSRIIVQFMQNQHLKNQARRRQKHSDENMNTDFSKIAVPSNLEIMVLLGQAHAMERLFWARETSTEWWDCIVLQVWDDAQWLGNFRMRKGTFMELCDLLSPALKCKSTKVLERSPELERGAAPERWSCRFLPGAGVEPEHISKALY
ncbi:hypothetical protein UY3_02784 [Chelonia mydas]|uniref:Uncharacterized protein n=1 Tax=Chelonia mydas TaxID=8469 RepID=M7BPY5_CHEMY|nr:hypothetical protein UY3_02784 [Chelonia mydas]